MSGALVNTEIKRNDPELTGMDSNGPRHGTGTDRNGLEWYRNEPKWVIPGHSVLIQVHSALIPVQFLPFRSIPVHSGSFRYVLSNV